MSNSVLKKQIEELNKSIITQGMGQFSASNIDKLEKLNQLIAKLNNNEKI